MTNHHPHEIELVAPARPLVLQVRVAGDVAIDLFANAAMRWLCRRGIAPMIRVVGIMR